MRSTERGFVNRNRQKNNDDRVAQMAYFAVMMKARQYDHRFFSRGIQPNVCYCGEQ